MNFRLVLGSRGSSSLLWNQRYCGAGNPSFSRHRSSVDVPTVTASGTLHLGTTGLTAHRQTKCG